MLNGWPQSWQQVAGCSIAVLGSAPRRTTVPWSASKVTGRGLERVERFRSRPAEVRPPLSPLWLRLLPLFMLRFNCEYRLPLQGWLLRLVAPASLVCAERFLRWLPGFGVASDLELVFWLEEKVVRMLSFKYSFLTAPSSPRPPAPPWLASAASTSARTGAGRTDICRVAGNGRPYGETAK